MMHILDQGFLSAAIMRLVTTKLFLYFEVTNEGILPNQFVELYNFYKIHLILEHWCKPFESNEKLCSIAKLGAMLS
jgi:hypothetical protein